jgi:uncharacterized LabA/DUF88 family protein
MKRVAVLIDGGFLRKKLQSVEADKVYDFACGLLVEGEELFRIYYYDSPPFEGKRTHPISSKTFNFKDTRVHAENSRMLRDLSLKDHVAFRAGKLKFRGWRLSRRATDELVGSQRALCADDLTPHFEQKRVDMKIGLDVAWLASKRIVDRLILCTGDSDFVPAMKFARREGVQVVLAHMGAHVDEDLIIHADEVRHAGGGGSCEPT